jgi:formate hydrogenlyase subunit 3/multisubunit Na+/H+ antiporter MnhD subunit
MLTAEFAALALWAAASVVALLGQRRALAWVYLLSAAGAGLAAVGSAVFLLDGAAPLLRVLPIGLPWQGTALRVDALSAFFLLVVNGGACLISLYAVEYGAHDAEPARVLPFFPLFIAGMNLVLLAADAFAFLVSWEFMSLTSWLLVLANHREQEAGHGAFLYLVMASLGTGALLLAFGLFAVSAGSYAFADMQGAKLGEAQRAILFALILVGTGSKAGMVPLHAWLPPAHAAAPSHVSALMSGIMTKVAIYGLVRLLFDLAGPPAWWWGAIVLLLGGVTALLGVLYAVMQHDLKRLLAYHTVENIGIIIIGLGLALAFRAARLDALAALALTAALLHVLNHAVFKSLLFLGSGAVLVATGERDMEHLGGLIHRMPVTAFVFLIGAVAISALPPFNGFVSEWLTFQAILNGAQLPQWLLKFAVPAVGAMLALAAALTAVCFVKVYGIVFLGRARTFAASEAVEVGLPMKAAMAALAALCVVVGVVPQAALILLRGVPASLWEGAPPVPAPGWLWLQPLGPDHSSYSGGVVLCAVAALAGLLGLVIHRVASRRLRRSAAWDCGFPDACPQTQYTASSFAQPIRRVFGTAVFGAREHIDMPGPGELRPARFEAVLRDPIWEWLYLPVAALVMAVADRVNVVQFQTIRRYLSLMFAALILLLLVVAVSQ